MLQIKSAVAEKVKIILTCFIFCTIGTLQETIQKAIVPPYVVHITEVNVQVGDKLKE